jgi:ubiquinone/menaquinone biosynthesis C-methylase UbiE
MPALTKIWDHHVSDAEEIARGAGFQALRDRILDIAAPRSGDRVVDVGAGTGLLTLPLADRAAHVWAIDIAAPMCEYLRTKAASAGLDNIDVAVASAVSLPLVDESADLVVSNYCFHHLDDAGKERALREILRVLRPDGQLVFGDMMFRVGLVDARDREVVTAKVRAMLRKGPRGMLRLAKNGLRFASGTWEQPARAEWWCDALTRCGFVEVAVEELAHEGGIASARKP